ncbi:hypothetical protein FXO38_10011 [Capsicum annuum]|nr:hypothetical protein FXO38_10011 [Capsicum annuum]
MGICAIHCIGALDTVVGSSPSVAKEILKTHDRILSARHVPNVVPSKGSDLDTTSLGWNSGCNSRWRYLRTLCKTELFSAKVLDMVNLEEGREDGEQKNLVRDFVYNKFPSNPVKELLSAGSDAITSKIEWAIAELIKNVDSMKKVQEELEIELSDSDYPKESQLLQMSYV